MREKVEAVGNFWCPPPPVTSSVKSWRSGAGATTGGYDFLWVGEHHFAPNQWNPSPLPLLAAIAARTTTLRLGVNVIVAPYHNPLRLAEDIATVDLLSNGRLDVVLDTGSIRDEFDTFAVPPAQRWGRTFETAEILRRCFSEERFDHEGRCFTFPDVRMTTQPVQRPMPLWVASAGPKTIERVARAGFHFQTPVMAQLGPFWERYSAAARAAGHDPDTKNFHVFTGGSVAEQWTPERAAAYEAGARFTSHGWGGIRRPMGTRPTTAHYAVVCAAQVGAGDGWTREAPHGR